MKLKLIPNWRDAWKMWSIRLAALGTALMTLVIGFPDAALSVWAILPAEFKTFIPEGMMQYVGLAIFALSIAARLIKQPALHAPEKTDDRPDVH